MNCQQLISMCVFVTTYHIASGQVGSILSSYYVTSNRLPNPPLGYHYESKTQIQSKYPQSTYKIIPYGLAWAQGVIGSHNNHGNRNKHGARGKPTKKNSSGSSGQNGGSDNNANGGTADAGNADSATATKRKRTFIPSDSPVVNTSHYGGANDRHHNGIEKRGDDTDVSEESSAVVAVIAVDSGPVRVMVKDGVGDTAVIGAVGIGAGNATKATAITAAVEANDEDAVTNIGLTLENAGVVAVPFSPVINELAERTTPKSIHYPYFLSSINAACLTSEVVKSRQKYNHDVTT